MNYVSHAHNEQPLRGPILCGDKLYADEVTAIQTNFSTQVAIINKEQKLYTEIYNYSYHTINLEHKETKKDAHKISHISCITAPPLNPVCSTTMTHLRLCHNYDYYSMIKRVLKLEHSRIS